MRVATTMIDRFYMNMGLDQATKSYDTQNLYGELLNQWRLGLDQATKCSNTM